MKVMVIKDVDTLQMCHLLLYYYGTWVPVSLSCVLTHQGKCVSHFVSHM